MDRRVQRVIFLMKNNLYHEIQLTDMARVVGLSPSRLRHMFKAHINKTPTQYLSHLRMQEAKEQLETTSLSVKEIMTSVGVSDPSNFTRAFKRAYGLTPTQLRSRAKIIVLFVASLTLNVLKDF